MGTEDSTPAGEYWYAATPEEPCPICARSGPVPRLPRAYFGTDRCLTHPSGLLVACGVFMSPNARRNAEGKRYWIHIRDPRGIAVSEGADPDLYEAASALAYATGRWRSRAERTGLPGARALARVLRALVVAVERNAVSALRDADRWALKYLTATVPTPMAWPSVLPDAQRSERTMAKRQMREQVVEALRLEAEHGEKFAGPSPGRYAASAFVTAAKFAAPGSLPTVEAQLAAEDRVLARLDEQRERLAGSDLELVAESVIRAGFRALGWPDKVVQGFFDFDDKATKRRGPGDEGGR